MTTMPHPAGRFVSNPIQRGNLANDLRQFILEAVGFGEEAPTDTDVEAVTQLSHALIINVLDAYLDHAYWQGRAEGYANHHGAVSPDAASITTITTTEEAGARA